jgi:hypothetical protein
MSKQFGGMPKHHCNVCDFGSDSIKIYNEHFDSAYHREAVMARKHDKKETD